MTTVTLPPDLSVNITTLADNPEWEKLMSGAVAKLPKDGPLMRIFKRIAELEKLNGEKPESIPTIAIHFFDSLVLWQNSPEFKAAKDNDDRAQALNEYTSDAQWFALEDVCDPVVKHTRLGHYKRGNLALGVGVLALLGAGYNVDQARKHDKEAGYKQTDAYVNSVEHALIAQQQTKYDKMPAAEKQWVRSEVKKRCDIAAEDELDLRNKRYFYAALFAAGTVLSGLMNLLNSTVNREARAKFVAAHFQNLDAELDELLKKRSADLKQQGLSVG
jgi:hypothetical protein